MTEKNKTINELKEVLDSLDITNKYRLNLIRAIEYLQEEPVKIKKGCKYRSICNVTNNDTGNISFVAGKIYLAPEDDTLVSEENGWRCDTSKNASNFELVEEPASVWHDASEKPDDKSNCLIYYTVGGKVSYRDIFPVLYNKDVKEFVSEPYPHPTGYKVEQKSLDGGCVAEVFKNVRDRFPLSDIYKWAYIDDLLKF